MLYLCFHLCLEQFSPFTPSLHLIPVLFKFQLKYPFLWKSFPVDSCGGFQHVCKYFVTPPVEGWLLSSLPLNLSVLWLLWPIENCGRNTMWLVRLGHKKPCIFYLVYRHTFSWHPDIPCKQSGYSEASMMERSCVSPWDNSPSHASPSTKAASEQHHPGSYIRVRPPVEYHTWPCLMPPIAS